MTAASSYGIFAPFNFPLNASLKPGLTYNLQSSWQFVHNHFLGLCCRYVRWCGDLGERQSPKPQVWYVQNHARARGSTDYFGGRWWHKKGSPLLCLILHLLAPFLIERHSVTCSRVQELHESLKHRCSVRVFTPALCQQDLQCDVKSVSCVSTQGYSEQS